MKPKRGGLLRTTLTEIAKGCWLPPVGVYVIADGPIIYVGMAAKDLNRRFSEHFYHARRGNQLGRWIYSKEGEWHTIRVDILVPPTDCSDIDEWLKLTERRCIRQFNPMINTALVEELSRA